MGTIRTLSLVAVSVLAIVVTACGGGGSPSRATFDGVNACKDGVCPTSNSCGCTVSAPFWANHPEYWPVDSLALGGTTYTKAQLLEILRTPAGDNGLVSLAQQLIAAKLNLANGACADGIADAIAAADAAIGAGVVPPVGGDVLDPCDSDPLATSLAAWSEGLAGPGRCEEDVASRTWSSALTAKACR